MKIFFGFTVAGDRSAIGTARRVVRLLEESGHEVLTRQLVEDNAWEADRQISAQDVYRRDMARLDRCEIFIAGSWNTNCRCSSAGTRTSTARCLLTRRQKKRRDL